MAGSTTAASRVGYRLVGRFGDLDAKQHHCTEGEGHHGQHQRK